MELPRHAKRSQPSEPAVALGGVLKRFVGDLERESHRRRRRLPGDLHWCVPIFGKRSPRGS